MTNRHSLSRHKKNCSNGSYMTNRHSLSRHKKNCSNGSCMTNQLHIGVRRSLVPAASQNFSLEKTDHQPRNPKIQKLVDEKVNGGNSTSSFVNGGVTLPPASAEVSSSLLERFDHKDALSTPTSQVTPEVIPAASRTTGDIIGDSDDDDTESMGSDTYSESVDELQQPPPSEVIGGVFSSMIDTMPRTKE